MSDQDGKPPRRPRSGGPRSEKGRRAVSQNSRRHGLFAVTTTVPPIARCPLKGSPVCECDTADGAAPCPRFLALEAALTGKFLKVPHIRHRRECWPLVRELVKGFVCLEVADCWTARASWARATRQGLDTQPMERARSTRAAEVRRLCETLGLTPLARSALRASGPPPLDLATSLAQVARREEEREP